MNRSSVAGAAMGITRAAARGVPTVYRFARQQGLDDLSRDAVFSAGDPARFRARLLSAPLHDVAFEDLAVSGSFAVERSLGRIRAFPTDAVRVSLIYEGSMRAGHGGRTVRYCAGDLFAVDQSKPIRAAFEDSARLAMLVLPRRLLNLHPGKVELIEDAPLPESALSPLFRALLREMSAHVPADDTSDAEHLSRILVDFARALTRKRATTNNGCSSDDLIRRRVHEIVEREYSDPGIGRDSIAGRLRVSVSSLHRLFADESRSVARIIRERRVRAVMDDLVKTSETFEALASKHGFGSTDAAYRSFRAECGMTPSEYRRRHSP